MTALDPLDHPIALGRTPREILLVSGGLAITVWELSLGGFCAGHANPGNIAVYLGFTAALWLRFYAARGMLVALIIAAMAQVLPNLRAHHAPALWLSANWGLLVLWGAGLLLLSGRDLVARYDRAVSRHRLLPNFWASLDARDARGLRWCGYALAACIGASVAVWRASALAPTWLLPMIVTLCVAAALLCLGRAVVLLALPLLGLAAVLLYAPHVGVAEAQLAARCFLSGPRSGVLGAPGHVLVALMAAALAGLFALPYAVRVARRARAAR